jgi:hypothetical protein
MLYEQALFLKGADSLRAYAKLNFFPINHYSFSLEIWLPNFLCVALRKANIASKLLAFTGDIAFIHVVIPL